MYALTTEIANHHVTKPIDKIFRSLYLPRIPNLPTYSTKICPNKAWNLFFYHAFLSLQDEILFNFPYGGDFRTPRGMMSMMVSFQLGGSYRVAYPQPSYYTLHISTAQKLIGYYGYHLGTIKTSPNRGISVGLYCSYLSQKPIKL